MSVVRRLSTVYLRPSYRICRKVAKWHPFEQLTAIPSQQQKDPTALVAAIPVCPKLCLDHHICLKISSLDGSNTKKTSATHSAVAVTGRWCSSFSHCFCPSEARGSGGKTVMLVHAAMDSDKTSTTILCSTSSTASWKVLYSPLPPRTYLHGYGAFLWTAYEYLFLKAFIRTLKSPP